MATAVTFEKPVRIGGKTLEAGKYALFTIPSKNEWTVIINRKWQQHLTDEYSSDDDVLRIRVLPEMQTNSQERLMYTIDLEGISMRWEKVKLVIPVLSTL
jgi:hypothetical protein